MATFKSVVTKLGQASIAAAIQSGKDINITEMAVGDGGGKAVQPVATQTQLVKEVYRTKLNSLKLDAKNANWVVAEAIISASVGGFWMREMGLYTDDGVLIAVCNMADTYKPTLAEGSGRTQTLRMVITVTDTSAVSLTIDDSLVMATEEFVSDKIAEHEKTRNHPDATLTEKGLVQLSSATNSTSEAVAATPKAVKAANDNANGRLPSDGTAVAASKLAAARKIAGNDFDGTKDIEIKAENVGAWSADTSEKNAKALRDEIATAFKIRPPLTAADSLNTLRGLEMYGHYGVPGIAAATKAKGYPIDGFVGAIFVMLGGNGTQQVAFASTGRQWTRYMAGAWNGIDGPWTGWAETYSEKNKPTASDVGALPSNGTAVAASKLATARKIAGVDFDGSSDITIGASDVGALSTAGGDVEYINGARHFASKPGVWEGAGGFAAQYENGSAPFMVPLFSAGKGFSQYHPIVKGIAQTKDFGYGAAVSFGVLTSGNAEFPVAVISVTMDSRAGQVWSFNPVDGSFYSPGDINTGKNISAGGGVHAGGDITSGGNIISGSGAAMYERNASGLARVYSPNNPQPLPHDLSIAGNISSSEGGIYERGQRVYSPNYRPLPAEIGAMAQDTCSVAGFVAGNAQNPYMRNSNNNEVVLLARQDYVARNFVSSVRLVGRTVMQDTGGRVDLPAGCVYTGMSGANYNPATWGAYSAIQVWVNGGWATIGSV